jgi:heme-degrading monooxygenase HmoA
MFIHLAVHYPRAEHAGDLLASMLRVDAAAKGTPGLIEMGAWRDEDSGALIGLARWESAAAFQAAAEQVFQVVANDPFDQWCERPTDVFHLTQP